MLLGNTRSGLTAAYVQKFAFDETINSFRSSPRTILSGDRTDIGVAGTFGGIPFIS